MKTYLFLLLAVFPIRELFSQTDYSITLKEHEHFVQLPKKQLVDSVNLNQTGPEQFEYFEVDLKESDTLDIYRFMNSCKKIEAIIDRYGSPGIDVCMWSNSNIKRPISGYYYAVGYIDSNGGKQLVLKVLYPRFDDALTVLSRLQKN
jgi:hypothetical protein